MTPAGNEKLQVLLLSGCLAIGMSCAILIMTAAAVVGTMIAPTHALATLPLALMFVGTMASTIPASLLMKYLGRHAGFVIGATIGLFGGVLATLAVEQASFLKLCLAMLMLGAAQSITQYYRFAAADVASPKFRPTAISWVMAGGVISALLGPNLANWAKDAIGPVLFVGTFATLPVLQAMVLLILNFVRIPQPSAVEQAGPSRPIREIAQQPTFRVAVLGGVIGYAGMNFVMVATPLAIMDCGYGFADAAFILQWHVLGMYAPAFITGSLVGRVGAPAIMLTGAFAFLACGFINLSSVDLSWGFQPALILLGVGWNFLFVGGTSLLTTTYTPAEKAKVQGVNDLTVFTAVAFSALTSGGVHNLIGWGAVNVVLLLLASSFIGVMYWYFRQRQPAAATT